MQKPAETDNPIHELLRQRWSPLAFSDQMILPADLNALFEAARWAPSCFNDQPWHFIVGTKEDPETFRKVLGCLVDRNVVWAQYAPVLLLTVTRRHFAHNGHPNRHAWHDIGLAVGSMLVQAESLGIRVHQMAGFDPEQARDVFDIPEDYDAVTAIALGYPGEPDVLPEACRIRESAPRTRKPLKDFVYGGIWGKRADFVPEQ